MRIALITDFGTRDPYVAAMKGVIAARTDAPIIDLTHEIAPFDAWEAAFFLRDVIAFWPAETIFVVVADPGVGTARRIIAIQSEGRVFLAPDNGVLHFVSGAARSVEAETLFLPVGSTTFHGRDRFAPVAAALAQGLAFERLGPSVTDRVKLDYELPTPTRGTIIRVDRFGNLMTDIACGPASVGRAVKAGRHTISRWASTYEGEGPFLIRGSTGCIEISVAQASAATLLQLGRGERVEIA